MKIGELREMSDEQVQLTWKEASENLFRLRLQAQTERLDAPSELRRHRHLIAQCQTLLNDTQACCNACPKRITPVPSIERTHAQANCRWPGHRR